MPATTTITPRIIEALYCEALVLSDEVRASFALAGRLGPAGTDDDLARVALSCEGLRTTTRMMHALAWLLNHRAYLTGDLSEFQLHRYGRLTVDNSRADPEYISVIDAPTRELIVATERFYKRLLRLDHGWRDGVSQTAPTGTAIARLRERLNFTFAK